MQNLNKKIISYINQKTAQKIDQDLFKHYLKSELAMELAGQGVAHSTYDIIKNLKTNKKMKNNSLTILCGPGNNGGDGLVAARHLSYFDPSLNINVFFFKEYKDKHKNDLLDSIKNFDNINISKFEDHIFDNKNCDLILDCIFGFSFKGPIRNNFLSTFCFLKNTDIPIVSIDVPSGWEIEKGNIYDTFVPYANISLGTVKICMKDFENLHYFVNFFMPKKLLDNYSIKGPFYDNSKIFCVL